MQKRSRTFLNDQLATGQIPSNFKIVCMDKYVVVRVRTRKLCVCMYIDYQLIKSGGGGSDPISLLRA